MNDSVDNLTDLRRAGANQYDLGSFNEAVIIETIRLAGIISRTEISRRTGLTQQSVSRILRILLQQGLLVEEAQERAERLGKPRTPVRMRSNAAHAVGIHIDRSCSRSRSSTWTGRSSAARPSTSPTAWRRASSST